MTRKRRWESSRASSARLRCLAAVVLAAALVSFTTQTGAVRDPGATMLEIPIETQGRAASIQLDKFQFRDVPVSFAPDSVRSKQPGADAVICGSLFGRFNTVYDYAGGRLYLSPRKQL